MRPLRRTCYNTGMRSQVIRIQNLPSDQIIRHTVHVKPIVLMVVILLVDTVVTIVIMIMTMIPARAGIGVLAPIGTLTGTRDGILIGTLDLITIGRG